MASARHAPVNPTARRSCLSRGRTDRPAGTLGAFALMAAAAVIAAGCGGDDAPKDGVPVVGFITTRDASGTDDKIFATCNEQADGAYRIEPVVVGPTTDAAREQISRRLAAGDATIDIINLDTIWTAEFSDAGWIMDLSERVEPIADQFIPAALQSTFYKDRYWAVPAGTDVALLYYRTDLVADAPSTWEDVAKIAARVIQEQPEMAGLVFQGAPYEGGTVDALEFMFAADGRIISDDGKDSVVADGDGVEHALEFLAGLMSDGTSPKVVTTFNEEDTRLAFQNGTAVFMRNWPYAYTLMNMEGSSKVQGKFAVAPLPAFEGRSSAGVLGGQNFGIASTADDPELAWQAIECLAGEASQRARAIGKGQLPTRLAMFDDPQVRKGMPFIDVSRAALDAGMNRPISPYYNDMTGIIYRAYNDVLAGRATPAEAVERIDGGVQAAAEGRPEI